MPDGHKNFAYSTVVTAPSPADTGTSLVVQTGDGTKFPIPPFNVTVWPVGDQPLTTNAEILRVTAISGDTFTITRTQEGTAARAIMVGDQIAATITAKTLTDIEAVAIPWKTRNLIVENDGAAPTSKVKVTADEITIQDVVVATLNVTADIAISGANGLDTGTETANTWYAIWLIYNPTTAIVASLLSGNFTTPVLPSGYTKKRRVGAIRNDASSNFLRILQLGEFAQYQNADGEWVVNNAGPTTTFSAAGAGAFVPPSARRVLGFFLFFGSNVATFGIFTRPTGSGVTSGKRQIDIRYNAVWGGTESWLETNSAQSFDWRHEQAPSVGSSTYIGVKGYVDPVQ